MSISEGQKGTFSTVPGVVCGQQRSAAVIVLLPGLAQETAAS